MRNSCIIGGFSKAAGIEWDILEQAFRKNISREIEINLKVALRGFNEARKLLDIGKLEQEALPILTGNEAVSLGLINAGLKTYISYPMTPSSPILHYLASLSEKFSLKVIHPESEISVILMALGFAYAGEKVAVGTSGGGFCLMTEALSFSGMSELPIVIFLGQRPGPSTGLPTYSSQTELLFALHAGQGEFPRLIVAPGDPQEAYYWSGLALNMAWKYQIPAFILSDKNLSESVYSFDVNSIEEIKEEKPALWDRAGNYKRYLDTESGISALAFVPDKDAVIKVNSYEHDEFGITTEEPLLTKKMQDKRLRKEEYLKRELENYNTVKTYGNNDSAVTLLCWGSNKGVCVEAAKNLNLKVVQPLVLNPFPAEQLRKSLEGAKKIIDVESNATAQLAILMSRYGLKADAKILKYDGRPFSLEELEEEIKKVIL